MASLGLLFFAGIFVLAGVGMGTLGANRLRAWRTMRRMEPSDRVLEPGLQEFEGRAHAIDESVTAPLTGTQSLICEYEIERYDHDDDSSNWETVSSGVDTVPFEVDQGASTVAVDPDGATSLLTEEFRVDTRTTDDLPPRLREYADDNLDLGSTFEIGPIELGGRRHRFTEERLDGGEEVYVLGPTELNPSSPPGDSDARLAVAPGERSWRQRLLGDQFVVSDTSEGQVTRRQLKSAVGFLLFGLVFAGGGIAVIVLA